MYFQDRCIQNFCSGFLIISNTRCVEFYVHTFLNIMIYELGFHGCCHPCSKEITSI